jgi:hypothetical protein
MFTCAKCGKLKPIQVVTFNNMCMRDQQELLISRTKRDKNCEMCKNCAENYVSPEKPPTLF